MRTFVLKARKASMNVNNLRTHLGSPFHFEVILHAVMNAFFVASDFRTDVELFIVFDSAQDFPRTLKLSSVTGLSLPGFHEQALLEFFQAWLPKALAVEKNQILSLAPGIEVLGHGLERLIQVFLAEGRRVFLLEPRGMTIDQLALPDDPVFLLSDHLMMPKKTVQGLKRRGVSGLSLGSRMLFASQCVVLLQHACDCSAQTTPR